LTLPKMTFITKERGCVTKRPSHPYSFWSSNKGWKHQCWSSKKGVVNFGHVHYIDILFWKVDKQVNHTNNNLNKCSSLWKRRPFWTRTHSRRRLGFGRILATFFIIVVSMFRDVSTMANQIFMFNLWFTKHLCRLFRFWCRELMILERLLRMTKTRTRFVNAVVSA